MLLILVFITIVTTLWYYSKRQSLNYWTKRGFASLPNTNFFLGDCVWPLLGRESFSDFYRNAHFYFKKQGHKVGGLYIMNLPMLLVTDNELTKTMLQTDFDAFADRGIDVDVESNPLSAHMFSLDGDAWQSIRKKLSPTFTSGKIKNMFPIVEKHVDTLIAEMQSVCDNGNADIKFEEWLDRVGVDIITHIAFGLDCNTLKRENEEFFAMTQKIMKPPKWKTFKMLMFGLTNPANLVSLLSSDPDLTEFFIKTITETIEHRRKTKVKANDFLQSLMDLLDAEEDGITMGEAFAQAFVFFVAGFETTTRTLIFTLFELAQRPELQEKLRKELKKAHDEYDGYAYEWIMTNETLDTVIKEALRLYPPVITLNRMTTRDYTIKDLGLTIPKRTCIVFSSMGFHYDPDYFDKPTEFMPERFLKANANKLKPSTNLSFGDGPRFCIGKRFGYMQTKLNLAKLLLNYKVLPSKLTDYPMKINPLTSNLLLSTENPIYFKFRPL